MFGIGMPELVLILIIGLIVFGPGKLPEMGRTLGKGMREFRKASNMLTQAMNEPEPPKKAASAKAAGTAETAKAEATAKPVADKAGKAAGQEGKAEAAEAASNKDGEVAEAHPMWEESANPFATYQPPTQESMRQELAGKEAAEKENAAKPSETATVEGKKA